LPAANTSQAGTWDTGVNQSVAAVVAAGLGVISAVKVPAAASNSILPDRFPDAGTVDLLAARQPFCAIAVRGA